MIRTLHIKRFKRFKSLELDLSPLTILTGLNSSGKTSVIHALLLLRQAALDAQIVQLNGPYGLAMGEALDILHRGSSLESIELAISSTLDSPPTSVILNVPEERALHLELAAPFNAQGAPDSLINPDPAFTYICAERHGPRDVHVTEARQAERLGVGVYGQHCAQLLDARRRREVSIQRLAPLFDGELDISALHLFERQCARWLSHILGMNEPIDIEAKWHDGTNITSLRFKMPGQAADWTRPHNLGFGVSYALPIVVAGLLAKEDNLLIIENPEAHLHPAGQSIMGQFLATVAADGVQVIVETHSEHIINGMRRAVALQETNLKPEDSTVVFFHNEDEQGQLHTTIELKDTGELSAWPKGFFDQIERDLGAIARARRGRRRP